VGLNDVRAALRSAAPLVVVEAPAGCGKTYEAIGCAVDLAADLREGQEVLLLAHTNVAVGEFRRRARAAGARVHATTLDGFALGLVAPYAGALALSSPLVPGDGPGETPFHLLAPKALELLRRAPSLAAVTRRHYPVVLLDEHQDTRQDQHELALELGRASASRTRIFGDPMQAIYGFGGEALVEWEGLARDAEVKVELDDPQRWSEAPDLGSWILRARHALRNGDRLPLVDAPDSVRLVRIPGLDDVPNPNSDRVPAAIMDPLRIRLRDLRGSVAVLGRNNAHVRGLFSAVRGSLVVQEGVDFHLADEALAVAEGSVGNPQGLSRSVIDLLGATCRGLDAGIRRQLKTSLQADRLDRGHRQRIASLLDALEPIYQTPDVATWCLAIGRILRAPPDWLKIDLPASLRLLARLRPIHEHTPREALDVAVRQRHDAGAVPGRCASTIHKAKGQEFDHVIVAHCSASPFPESPEARRLLYVALSRARLSITILASGVAPSPLLP